TVLLYFHPTVHVRTGDHGTMSLRRGSSVPRARGPAVASPMVPRYPNAVGSYSGAYAIYRALAVATQALARDHRPDLTDTAPAALIPPHPQWGDPAKIVSLDPWGHLVGAVFAEYLRAGVATRPTIALTRARIATTDLPPMP